MLELWKPDYDPDEFADALFSFYGRSNGSADETNFGGIDMDALTIKWKRGGGIGRMLRGPAFEEDDIPRLQEALGQALENSDTSVCRYMVTTFRPLEGAFGFEDWFSLLPPPPEAPRPGEQNDGGHPAVVEVQIAATPSFSVRQRRGLQSVLEVEALFATLTKERVALLPRGTRHHWVADPEDPARSFHARSGYQVPDFAFDVPALAKLEPYADIELVERDRYYAPGFHGSRTFAIPDTFPSLAWRYHRLDQARRERFMRGAYWAKQKNDLWHVSKAASYAAIIRAIEALMPVAAPGDPCESCGERPGRSTRKSFARFVDEMTGGLIPEKERLRLYDRRSRLVHGGQLFRWDDNLMMSGHRELGEMSELETVSQLVHIVFHNWLCEQD